MRSHIPESREPLFADAAGPLARQQQLAALRAAEVAGHLTHGTTGISAAG